MVLHQNISDRSLDVAKDTQMTRYSTWLALVGCLLLVFSPAYFMTQEMKEDADNADVSVEGEEDGKEESYKGQINLNLVDSTSEKKDPNFKPFIPTKEWQTVAKGQPLPKGLHYRLNLETGLTEAKLLDDESSQQKGAYKSPTSSLVTTDSDDTVSTSSDNVEDSPRLRQMKNVLAQATLELKSKESDLRNQNDLLKVKDRAYSREELKDALKKFKIGDDDVKDKLAVEGKSRFQSMKDIKQQLDEMNIKMKTDAEVIQQLVTKYKQKTLTDEEKISVLLELEYYVHQIDNAVDFTRMGGIELLIRELNNTIDGVRQNAAYVIGSASQSNPKVQIEVVKLGGVHKLIRMLSTDSSDSVRTRVMYALSCTLRNFPLAQKTFVENGGMHTLTTALTQKISSKLRLKAMTLAVDLLQEQEMVKLHTTIAKPAEFERLQQYNNVSLQDALLEHGWCSLVPTLIDNADHDAREKVLKAMMLLSKACPLADFLRARSTLDALKVEYEKLTMEEIQEEGQEGYFGGLLKLVNDLVKIMSMSALPKQEL